MGPNLATKASDPRDVIFSLWGTYIMPDYLKPDYNLTTAKVFERVVEVWMWESNSLAIVACSNGIQPQAHLSEDSGERLPSFVPDWSQPLSRVPIWRSVDFHRRLDRSLPYFHAARAHSTNKADQTYGSLLVSGSHVGYIEYILPFGFNHFGDRVYTMIPDCWYLSWLVSAMKEGLANMVKGEISESRLLCVLCAGPGFNHRSSEKTVDDTYIPSMVGWIVIKGAETTVPQAHPRATPMSAYMAREVLYCNRDPWTFMTISLCQNARKLDSNRMILTWDGFILGPNL